MRIKWDRGGRGRRRHQRIAPEFTSGKVPISVWTDANGREGEIAGPQGGECENRSLIGLGGEHRQRAFYFCR